MKTESRDRKQKEAAAAFVVAEECGNVEALCQTFLKWGQVTFSQRGKATTTTKKVDGAGDRGEARLLPFLSAGADSPGSKAARLAAAPPLPVWPSAWLRPLVPRLGGLVPRPPPAPRTSLHLLRRILNGENVRGPVLSAVPSARRPRGSRSLYL